MSSLSYYGKIPRFHVNVCSCIIILYSIFTKDFVYIINWENLFISRYKYQFLILIYNHKRITFRGGSRIFFRRGCTCLLLYFNTNKPHIFFWQNTSCIRKPQVISGGVRTPCTLPLDPLLIRAIYTRKNKTRLT